VPDDKVLREQFLESGFSGIGPIANRETMETFVEWIEDLEQQMALKWHRPPRDGSRQM
jgi:hypothetical protein